MEKFRYIPNSTTLMLRVEACVGCGVCMDVCPHGVLGLCDKKVQIVDRDGCIECGACALNCPTGAVSVTPGVGCASYIINGWLKKYSVRIKGASCC